MYKILNADRWNEKKNNRTYNTYKLSNTNLLERLNTDKLYNYQSKRFLQNYIYRLTSDNVKLYLIIAIKYGIFITTVYQSE